MAQLVSVGLASLMVGGAVLLASPSGTRACGGLPCFAATFHPASGTVPANLKGIYWWPSRNSLDDGGAGDGEDAVRLARVDGATPELIDFHLESIPEELERYSGGKLIVPDDPFVVGARYILWDLGCNALSETEPPLEPMPDEENFPYPFLNGVEWSVARFTIAEAAPLPTELGELAVSAQHDANPYVYEGAGCTDRIDAIARDVSLTLSASASPWADALYYESIVDGEAYEPQGGAQLDPYPGTAMAGRAKELVFAKCDDEYPQGDGVEPGAHRFELRARIPGEAAVLSTDESDVTLTCPPADAGATDGDAAIDEHDGGARDGGARDGSVVEPRDGGGAAQPPFGEHDDAGDRATNASSDGCGCRTTAPGNNSSALWIAWAMLWLTRRRTMLAR